MTDTSTDYTIGHHYAQDRDFPWWVKDAAGKIVFRGARRIEAEHYIAVSRMPASFVSFALSPHGGRVNDDASTGQSEGPPISEG